MGTQHWKLQEQVDQRKVQNEIPNIGKNKKKMTKNVTKR